MVTLPGRPEQVPFVDPRGVAPACPPAPGLAPPPHSGPPHHQVLDGPARAGHLLQLFLLRGRDLGHSELPALRRLTQRLPVSV